MTLSLSNRAMLFAQHAHQGQTYGDKAEPYYVHLGEVVDVLASFRTEIEITTDSDDPDRFERFLAAGWLHDVVEDCDITREEVQAKFGPGVQNLVWACSGMGENRKARNADIYAKIAQYPAAAIVKLADRIANVEHSAPGGKHRSMYRKEADAFAAVIQPHVPARMWARLEAALAA